MADFNWAINQLKSGKKIRRRSWDEDSFWCARRNTIFNKRSNFSTITMGLIKANDWELFKENKEKPKVVILDDNPVSIAGYSDEFPENWKKICEALEKEKKPFNLGNEIKVRLNQDKFLEKKLKEFIKREKEISPERLAKIFHDAYEKIAKRQNWETQESCKVEFEDLPVENRNTMILTAREVINYLNDRTDKFCGGNLR